MKKGIIIIQRLVLDFIKKVKNKSRAKFIIIGSILFAVLILITFSLILNRAEEKYNTIFDTAGGTAITESTILKDGRLLEPPTPTKYGFTFVEWQLNGKTYDFSKKVVSNIVLTAVWKSNGTTEIVTMRFDSKGGSLVLPIEISKGEVAVRPLSPKKEGYTFAGWYKDNKLFDFLTLIDEDITLIANWKKGNQEVKENQSNYEEIKPVSKINTTFSELVGKWYLQGYASVFIKFEMVQSADRKYGVEFNNISFDRFILFPDSKQGYANGYPGGGFFKTEEELMNHFKGYGYSIIKSGNALIVSQNGKTMKFTRNKAVFDMTKYNECIGTWYLNELLSDVSIEIGKEYEKNWSADVYWIKTNGFNLETLDFINKQNYYPKSPIGDIDIINNSTIFDKYEISRVGDNLYIGSGNNKLEFSKSKPEPEIDKGIKVEGLSLICPSESIPVGQSVTLNPEVTPNNATNKELTWSSSDTSIVGITLSTISNVGIIRADKLGKTVIIVKTNDGGHEASCTIETIPSNVIGLTLDITSGTVDVKSSLFITPILVPAYAYNTVIYWSSSDPNIATVTDMSHSGRDVVVNGKSPGFVTITARTLDGGYTASAQIEVKKVDVKSISIEGCLMNMYIGKTYSLTAKIEPYNATSTDVIWSTVYPNLATISPEGLIKSNTSGRSTIVVTPIKHENSKVGVVKVTTVDGSKSAYCYFGIPFVPSS